MLPLWVRERVQRVRQVVLRARMTRRDMMVSQRSQDSSERPLQCSQGLHGLVSARNYADERSFATDATTVTTGGS